MNNDAHHTDTQAIDEQISPAQARLNSVQRRILAALFYPGSNRTYRQRCKDMRDELVMLGDSKLLAVQRIRWAIIKWCRNQRAVVVRPADGLVVHRSLNYRALIDRGFSPEWASSLTTPIARTHLRHFEAESHVVVDERLSEHKNFSSWAGRIADRGPRLVSA